MANDLFFVLQGQQFTSGCSSSDFTVVIKGSSANFSCTIKSLEKEMIKCEPDIDFPGVNDEDAMIMVRTTKMLRLFWKYFLFYEVISFYSNSRLSLKT